MGVIWVFVFSISACSGLCLGYFLGLWGIPLAAVAGFLLGLAGCALESKWTR